jgi:hypothetical protein|nr:hypothetical protein [Kofleriaceae bacterium]
MARERLEQEIERLEARLDLGAEATATVGELAAVRRGLATAAATRGSFELPNVRLGFACKQRWDDMVGDDRVRACAGCDRPVFNLSEMTRAEAAAVLATRGLTPCVRFYRRPDGTVMTSDCPSQPRRAAHRLAVLAAGTTLAVAPAVAAQPADDPAQLAGEGSAVASPGSDAGSGSGAIIEVADDHLMGVPVEKSGFTDDVEMGIMIIDEPTRPRLEWSLWGRVGAGTATQPADSLARTIVERPPAAASTTISEAAVAADLTLGVAFDGDLRVGAWGELRTTTDPVAGGELVVEGSRLAGAGSLVLRVGANSRVVTGELGVGYVGSWSAGYHDRLRHVVGARVVLEANRALDDPRDRSITVGIEVEPIGALHAIYDLVTGP